MRARSDRGSPVYLVIIVELGKSDFTWTSLFSEVKQAFTKITKLLFVTASASSGVS